MEKENSPNSAEEIVELKGIVSNQLTKDGISNESLGNDHIGVEILSVKPFWTSIVLCSPAESI